MKQYAFKRTSRTFVVGAIDAIGDLVTRSVRSAFPVKKPISWEELKKKDFQKILAIRLDHMGDVFLTLPAIDALRARFPQAKICVLVGPWAKDAVEGNENLDEIIVLSAPWFSRGKDRWSDLKQLLSLIRYVHEEGFDLGIEFRGDIRHSFLLWLAGVKVRIGYGIAGGGFLLTHEIPHLPGRHEVEYNLDLVRMLGWNNGDINCVFPFGEKERTFVESLLSDFGIGSDQAVVAIHPGAGLPWKRWAIERFAVIADWARQALKAKVVVLGGQEEATLAKAIATAAASPGDVLDLTGRTNLRQLAALLQRCRIFLGNDSAPAHVAAIVGTPAVILFSGANDPHRWRPPGEQVQVLYHPEACGPCPRRVCIEKFCLDAISVDEVKSAILKRWKP